MPPDIREHVLASTSDHIVATAHTGAAAIEYTEIARGRKEFAIYYRLLPWDHGAPALVLRESGGSVEHMDGQPYSVRSAHQITLVGRDSEMVQRLRGWIGQ
jgi:fructose-1,6-bisphosphatase/inositol monophosphatase family enzyme